MNTQFVVKLERKFAENALQWYIIATNNDGSTYMPNSGLTERGSKTVMTQLSKFFKLTKTSYDLAKMDGFDDVEQTVETVETDVETVETDVEKSELKSGLEFFIGVVENSKREEFDMGSWGKCVIGSTVGWKGNIWTTGDWQTLNHYFGTNFELNASEDAFCGVRSDQFNDDQWNVVRLFTSDIGNTLTKAKWLKLAKTQLEKLK